MKKVLLSAVVLGFMAFSSTAFAQDEKMKEEKMKDEKMKGEKMIQKEKERKRQSQEIIIRTKTDKDARITVEVNGDKVTINGKPLSEFKDDNITINKRNVMVLDNGAFKSFEMIPGEFANGLSWSDDGEPHAFLGVTTSSDNDGEENSKSSGAKITDITKESGAEKAGLKVGDIITKIDDKKIESPGDLTDLIGDKKPKDEVTVYYKRDGKENQAKAILSERKGMAYSFSAPKMAYGYSLPRLNVIPRIASPEINLEGLANPRIYGEGLSGYNMYSDSYPRHQKLGLKIQDTEDGNGVKVLDVDKDSPAEKAGLKKDDIVTEVGGKKVSNTDEAREQLQQNAEKAAYSIKVKRNSIEINFDIKIPKKLKTANL